MAGKLASHMSKPVASTSASISVSRPSVVTMPVGRDPLDRRRLEVDVVAGEGRVVVVGERRPLAAEGVVGGELTAQLGVGDLLAQVPLRDARRALVEDLRLPVVQHPGDHDRLEQRGVHRARDPLGAREPGEQRLDRFRHLEVELGGHPDRGALEDRQVLGPLRQLRDQLYGGGAGADDRDPLAVEVGGVVPLGGVQDGAGEVADALDVGQLRLGEEAGGGDQVRRPQPLAAGDPRPPTPGRPRPSARPRRPCRTACAGAGRTCRPRARRTSSARGRGRTSAPTGGWARRSRSR